MEKIDAIIILQDGRVFKGKSFGCCGERVGEAVFNTSMTGYQEILTDPSYKGQIVTMTYPHIGNYGVSSEDVESDKPKVEGFIVKEASRCISNWRAEESLEQYLKENDVMGVEGIDTRALTKHIREAGAMKCIISTEDFDLDSLKEKLENAPSIVGMDLVCKVTCKKEYDWEFDGVEAKWYNQKQTQKKYNVAALDFGMKRNIIRMLCWQGCNVRVFPAQTDSSKILDWNPDGIFLSNGPGDPSAVTYAIDTIKELIGKKPIFGICLGHQLLGLSLGSSTYKLKFGHRGANQPVQDLITGKVDITSQNHGFCVDLNSLPKGIVKTTHINLNDNTSEGMELKDGSGFSVQYHPEASPGPHDANYLFGKFKKMIEEYKRREESK